MKSFKFVAIAAALIACAGTAQAEDDGSAYINVGVDTLEFDNYGIGAKIGYDFADYFGIEVQGSLGIIDDEVNVGNVKVDVGYDYLVGAFAVGKIPVADNFDLLGRVGYYSAEVTAKTLGASSTDTIDGLALGVGGQYMLDEKNGVRLDYTYLDSDDGNADAFSLAYVRKF